jgi:hypothetical protein
MKRRSKENYAVFRPDCAAYNGLGGNKFDDGKIRMELLPLDALKEVARVLTHGAKKYAPWNWQKVENAGERYTGALLRHLAAWQSGEVIDPETGEDKLPHIAQVACNALFLVWLSLHRGDNLDIPERDGL